MNATFRIAAVVVAAATSGCAWPYFTTSHVDPADADWVVVVADDGDRGGPLQYRLDEEPPEIVMSGLVEFVESRRAGFATSWLPGPDGRRIAFVEHFPEGPHWTERSCVAAVDGPPWRITELADAGAPLAWAPDGRHLLCSASEKTGDRTWRFGLSLHDADASVRARTFFDIGRRSDSVTPNDVAFSPDGARVAFPTDARRIALLDVGSANVTDATLPESNGAGVLGWLADGRIAYRAADNRVLFARPGDASAAVFPTDTEDDWPLSARPDGGAVLCSVERTPMLSMYIRRGALVRYADGGREDLDFVEGHVWSFHDDIAVWFRAPGLPATPVR